MAIIEKNNEILLTGRHAVNFKRMADNPNKEIQRRKRAFLKEIKETLKYEENNGITKIKL